MNMYDELASLYDLFVDWPERLRTEIPALERLGVGLPEQAIVDVACGTGHHARAWAARGCRVVAMDASAEMIERARATDPDREVDWRVGMFGEAPSDAAADALVCLGTSLPHVDSRDGYRDALAAFARALKPGGVAVVHSRNLPRTLALNERFLPPLPRRMPEGTVLFWRFYDLHPPEHLDFNMVIFRGRADSWAYHVLTSRLCVIPADNLAAYARDAGFSEVDIRGALDGRPYDREKSPDLVLVARK